jgi:four helix bundle protein
MELVVETYRLAGRLPQSENYGLSSQMRRAAISIPANVAEGHGREHLGDYLHHVSISNGSLMELETHFLIADRLGYLTKEDMGRAFELTSEVGKMLAGLMKSLKSLNRS